MSDTKRILVWLFVLVWCVLSLAFDVRAQGTIDLSPLPEFTEQRCGEPLEVAANTIIIKKKAVASAAAGGGCTPDSVIIDNKSAGGASDSILYGTWWYSTFLVGATGFTATCVNVKLNETGGDAGTYAFYLYAVASNKPTGAAIASKTGVAASALPSANYYEVCFDATVHLDASTLYAFAIGITDDVGGSATPYDTAPASGLYQGSSSNQGSTWATEYANYTWSMEVLGCSD